MTYDEADIVIVVGLCVFHGYTHKFYVYRVHYQTCGGKDNPEWFFLFFFAVEEEN